MKKVLVALFAMYCTSIYGQSNSSIATAVPFLSNDWVAPKTSLAGIGTVSSSDDFSLGLLSNPALLHLDSASIGTYTSVLGSNFHSAGIAYAPNSKITIGYLYSHFGIKNDSGYDLIDTVIADYNASFLEHAHTLKFAYHFNNLHIGAGLKYFSSSYERDYFDGKPKKVEAVGLGLDLGVNYKSNPHDIGDFKFGYELGADVQNIGPKISYHKSSEGDFIPTELNVGGLASLSKEYTNNSSLKLSLMYEAEKMLVPSPSAISEDGTIIHSRVEDPSAFQALFTSFYDAPNGFSEEMDEILHRIGFSISYSLNEKFNISARGGKMFESENKGGRNWETAGFALNYSGLGIQYSHVFHELDLLVPNDFLSVTYKFSV